jgi:hypothetical protein
MHHMDARSSPPDRRIAELAAGQFGVVACWQLEPLGIGRGAIARRLANGRLHPVHEGVYAVGHPRIGRYGHLMAAVLAFGPGALLSHRPAAEIYGLLGRTSGRPHVSSDARSLVGRPGIRLHRCRRIDPALATAVDGIPVTTVPRVLVDLCADRRDDLLVKRAWQQADRLGLLDVRAVAELVDASPGRRVRPLMLLIGLARDTPDTREELEARFADLMELCPDLPDPAYNVAIGPYVVDAVWVAQRVVVELDSRAFHDSDDESFEDARIRHAELQLLGYRVYPVTWREVTRHPDRVADTLRRLLRTGPSPTPAGRADGA